LDRFGSSFIEVTGGEDVELLVLGGKVIQELLSLLGVGSAKSANQSLFKTDYLGGLDDTLCQFVAFQNASENVDQQGFDFRMLVQNLESGSNLVHAGSSSDIQEIGGLASVLLNNVHSSHSQSRTIHHAANISIQGHIIKSGIYSNLLVRVDFFGSQTALLHGHQFGLPEFGVIVHIEFAVDAVKLILFICSPGVNL